MKSNTSHSSAAVTTTGPLLADSRGKTRTTKHNYPGRDGKLPNNNASALIRQQPSKMAFIPSGDSTLQIPVPFRPPVHRDPQKNWRRFQRSGGFSLLHNAFPLDHLVYDPKDMPEIPTPPPIIGGYSNNGGQLGQQNDANEKEAAQGAKNVNTNADNTAGNDFDTDSSKGINEPYGAAIGFSSDDDELYFPAWNMKENATSADANRLPKPLHRHGHRPSQNDNMIKDKQMQNKFGQGRIVPVADYAVAGTKAPSKSELPQKKLTSTMNVNAPEFVNTSASVYPPPGFEFRMNPLAPGFATQPQPQPGLPSMMMNYDLQPFPVMHIPPPMAMPGHYPPPPYPGQYPPRVMGEPNFWANRGHKENTAAPSRPAANPSKPSYANIARRQFDHRGGPNKGSAGQSTTIDALNRQVSQQTLGRPGRREARGEGFKKPDDKPSTFHKSNNSASSKNFRAVKKGPP
jgi:hypothetical protein